MLLREVAVQPASGPLHSHSGMRMAVLDQDVRAVAVFADDEPRDDLPLLHVSVQRRFARVPEYRPPALRGLRFRLLFDSGQVSEAIEGVSGLHRYRRAPGGAPASPTEAQ